MQITIKMGQKLIIKQAEDVLKTLVRAARLKAEN
jgi:hypothetical protein